jgi:hypothetical protein
LSRRGIPANFRLLGAVAVGVLAAASAYSEASPAKTWASAVTHEISMQAAASGNAPGGERNLADGQPRDSLAVAAAATGAAHQTAERVPVSAAVP